MSQQPPVKKPKKNKPTCTEPPETWPNEVWDTFKEKLSNNVNNKGKSYYELVPLVQPGEDGNDGPIELQKEFCHPPSNSNQIMVCVNGMQYQRPIHRIRFLLKLRELGIPFNNGTQASHRCLDSVNTSGKGELHCTNPEHMEPEDDKTNKARQRCAGWIYIHPFENNPGNYWYPVCVHKPPCLRYVPSTVKPSLLLIDEMMK